MSERGHKRQLELQLKFPITPSSCDFHGKEKLHLIIRLLKVYFITVPLTGCNCSVLFNSYLVFWRLNKRSINSHFITKLYLLTNFFLLD